MVDESVVAVSISCLVSKRMQKQGKWFHKCQNLAFNKACFYPHLYNIQFPVLEIEGNIENIGIYEGEI